MKPVPALAAFALAFVFAFGAAYAGPGESAITVTNRRYSPGFEDGRFVYFLSDRSVLKPGSTLWFFFSFRMPDRVLERSISLCRLDPAASRIHRLAVLEDKPPDTLSVRVALFGRRDDTVAVGIAKKIRNPKNRSAALQIYLFDEPGGRVSPVPDKHAEEAFEKFFSGLALPFETGPGVIPALKLEKEYLETVPPENRPSGF